MRTVLAPRLAAFDDNGDLVGLACEIAEIVRGYEEAAVDAFWDCYVEVAPSAFRPEGAEFDGYRRHSLRVLRMFLHDLGDQAWADEVCSYWRLTSGDADAIAAVRAAKSRQHDYMFGLVFDDTRAEPDRARKILSGLGRIAALENCVLAQSLGEGNRRKREEDLARYAQVFRDDIAGGVEQASGMGVEVRRRSAEAAEATRGMLAKASEVADAAERSADAMRGAAFTASGLIARMEEARGEVEAAATIAAHASDQAEAAVRVSETLFETAKAIGTIVQIIREVAGQTNLLSLNATIEAARAGDAGRGFAVVAQEVKSLATQTADATDNITAKIFALQAATRSTLEVNASIAETVAEVKRSATQVRAAIDAQARTVTEIIATVDRTAIAADDISATLSAIRGEAESVAAEIDALDGGFERVNAKLSDLQAAATDYVELVS